MIIINLLPHHLRPIKRTPLPYLAAAAILILALAGVALMFLAQQSRIAATRGEILLKESQLNTLASVVADYNELTAQKLDLEKRITTIQEILKDRIIWSQQLFMLTRLTPDNIWYSGIKVSTATFKETRVKRDPKTGKEIIDSRTGNPQTEPVSVRRPVLEVSGYVVPNEEGDSSVAPLTERTTEDPEFTSMFRLYDPRLTYSEFDGYEVRQFTLRYIIERGGEEEE